jgi:sugar phosphate permease
MSYGIGDVLIRIFLGLVLASLSPADSTNIQPAEAAYAWRGVFWTAAIMGAILLVPSWILLRNSPSDMADLDDISMEVIDTDDVYRKEGKAAHSPLPAVQKPAQVITVVLNLVRQPKFWILLVMVRGRCCCCGSHESRPA